MRHERSEGKQVSPALTLKVRATQLLMFKDSPTPRKYTHTEGTTMAVFHSWEAEVILRKASLCRVKISFGKHGEVQSQLLFILRRVAVEAGLCGFSVWRGWPLLCFKIRTNVCNSSLRQCQSEGLPGIRRSG